VLDDSGQPAPTKSELSGRLLLRVGNTGGSALGAFAVTGLLSLVLGAKALLDALRVMPSNLDGDFQILAFPGLAGMLPVLLCRRRGFGPKLKLNMAASVFDIASISEDSGVSLLCLGNGGKGVENKGGEGRGREGRGSSAVFVVVFVVFVASASAVFDFGVSSDVAAAVFVVVVVVAVDFFTRNNG
jgi:hypothetical protein